MMKRFVAGVVFAGAVADCRDLAGLCRTHSGTAVSMVPGIPPRRPTCR
ncbi:MAG: hypothetical protein ILP18_00765 [Treponema sp.]|nr:hypothetical protein [Treponema sp.]